jgi:hypothetical protein
MATSARAASSRMIRAARGGAARFARLPRRPFQFRDRADASSRANAALAADARLLASLLGAHPS